MIVCVCITVWVCFTRVSGSQLRIYTYISYGIGYLHLNTRKCLRTFSFLNSFPINDFIRTLSEIWSFSHFPHQWNSIKLYSCIYTWYQYCRSHVATARRHRKKGLGRIADNTRCSVCSERVTRSVLNKASSGSRWERYDREWIFQEVWKDIDVDSSIPINRK